MLSQDQTNKIKVAASDFFEKMTISASVLGVVTDDTSVLGSQSSEAVEKEVISIDIKTDEPQILIGQQGQTLFDIQRLLRIIISKKLEKVFYLNIDINDYKKKKIEYLKDLAKTVADQVSLTKEEKPLSPMSSYERRVIHAELSQRSDIVTESRGDGPDRHIVVKPK